MNRVVLKNVNRQVQITTSRPFFDDKVELNRVYNQVKSKGDITDSMRTKLIIYLESRAEIQTM